MAVKKRYFCINFDDNSCFRYVPAAENHTAASTQLFYNPRRFDEICGCRYASDRGLVMTKKINACILARCFKT